MGKVCAANLNKTLDKQRILDYFAKCGEIKDVYLVKDWYTWQFRGVCFITFADQNGVLAALKHDGKEFAGQWIRVNLALDKQMATGKIGKDSSKGTAKGRGYGRGCPSG